MTTAQPPISKELSSLDHATGWLNSEPLTADALRGRVVVVDFLTYTCINWLRSLPYVRAWSEKYADQGLVTIGAHTPEFAFERDLDNVRREMAALRVGFPVAVDSDYAIWRAFDNHYWPALYFIDAEARIRHHRFVEGDYERSEEVIQQLLEEAGHGGGDRGLVSVVGEGVEAPADWDHLGSPESYVGYLRAESLASPGAVLPGERRRYELPDFLPLNTFALDGEWTVREQAAVLEQAGGRVVQRFHARDLHLVMGPATRGASARFRMRLDGEPPGEDHGLDVDADGTGTLTEQRLHQLVRRRGEIVDRTFEIEFLDAGAAVYAFTFG